MLFEGVRRALGWKVTLAVFASILIIEAVVLVPSYVNFERDQLASHILAAKHTMRAALGPNPAATEPARVAATLDGTLIEGYRVLRGSETLLSGGDAPSADADITGTRRERRDRGSHDRMIASWRLEGSAANHTVIATLDTSRIGPALRGFVARITGVVLLIAAFVTATTMAVLQRMVLGPLLSLHARIREEDQSSGNEGEAPNRAGWDELEQTRYAFEGMLQRNKENLRLLAERKAEYQELNAALDERVAERTRELRQANAALEYRASHDTLTGLPNRELLHERLQRALADDGATGSRIAVMLVGLEEFASINGIHGYSTGDKVLQALAERLSTAVPTAATVARFGGDVFAIIVPCSGDYHDANDVAALAQSIRSLMEEPVALTDRSVECLTSIGLSAVNEGEETAESLMAQADIALIHAKRAGADRVQVFAEWMNQELARQLNRIAQLRRALHTDELYLAYQAQCRTDGQRTGVEALIRWHPREGESISPAEFIPIAESTGLINALGSRVLDEAIAQAADWHHAGVSLPVAINLSAVQLRQGDVTAEVEHLLAAYAFPAEQLTLEVTESALMQDLEQGRAVLERLSRLGVRLAIDDFGTGHSSLAYLARLPVDELKIDKQFVAPLPEDSQNKALCRAILEMGRALGKQIVAEGVETTDQRDWLAAQGCEIFQGFLFAQPEPADTGIEQRADATTRATPLSPEPPP